MPPDILTGKLEKKEMVAGASRCTIDGERYLIDDSKVLSDYRDCKEGDTVEYDYKGSVLKMIRRKKQRIQHRLRRYHLSLKKRRRRPQSRDSV